MASGKLDKYDYLTGEDLVYKLGVVEQAKFECSLLGKIFNKWLEEDDERLTFKEFTIFEDKNEEQLKTIKDLGEK